MKVNRKKQITAAVLSVAVAFGLVSSYFPAALADNEEDTPNTASAAEAEITLSEAEDENFAGGGYAVHLEASGTDDSDVEARLYLWDYDGDVTEEDFDGSELTDVFTQLDASQFVDATVPVVLADGTESETALELVEVEDEETGDVTACYLVFSIPAGSTIDTDLGITLAEDADTGRTLAIAYTLGTEEDWEAADAEEEGNDTPEYKYISLSYSEPEDTEEEEEALAVSSYGVSLMSSNGGEEDEYLWTFDNYYVNQSSLYYVEKNDTFNLKYQIEFHTSEELSANSVEIRIKAALMTLRDGTEVLPSDFGIPAGTPENPTSSSTTPFNYYYDGDELVFFNYKTISSGANCAFQVLYTVDSVYAVDMSEWSLTPVVTVTKDDGSVETVTGNEMSGLLDTTAVISSVTKTPYYDTDKVYTPALYTASQVSKYIEGDLPSEYSDNFNDYVYVVWKIKVKGSATQAWSMATEDISSVVSTGGSGSVVGYKWLKETSTDDDAELYGWENGTVAFCTEREINLKFLVVVAYPADEVEDNDTVANTLTEIITPYDGKDGSSSVSGSSTFSWVDYDWKYIADTINGIGIDKWAGLYGSEHTLTYNSMLEVWKNNIGTDNDTGSFEYHTTSYYEGFGMAYDISGDEPVYNGAYSQVTTYDDVVYAYPNSNAEAGTILGKDDYYFDSFTITVYEYSFDIWEMEFTTPDTTDKVDQDFYIYAKFAGSDEWEYVDTMEWTGSIVNTYTFSAETLAKEPWQVKVVHDVANVECYTSMRMTLKLQSDSPALLAYYEEYGDDLTELSLENLSGVSGEYYPVSGDSYFFHEQNVIFDNYSEIGLEDRDNETYGMLLMRDCGFAKLTGLTKQAESTKYAEEENDADNSRVLVDYYLTAFEGYLVWNSETKDTLQSQGVSLAGRTEAVFYDLLPYGMKYNASAGVTAGRITNTTNDVYMRNSRAWDTSGVSVTVGEEDVIEDWNGTGRTMVVFHISYDGDDPSAYTNGEWLEGYGIKFQAYYDWVDIGSVQSEYNIAAYMPEVGDTEPIYGTEGEVYCDDGTVPATANDDYSEFTCGDINGDGVTDIRNVLYARYLTATEIATSSSSSILKLVKADSDTFASYDTTTAVGYGDGYTYQVIVNNTSSDTLKNIVVYDVLEDALDRVDTQGETVFLDTDGSWQGTYAGIVTNALTNMGIDVQVYYNYLDSESVAVSESDEDPSTILTEENGWYKAEDFLELFELSDVTAVAVDCSTTTDGEAFELESGGSLSFMLKMTAPDTEQEYAYAYNNPSYYSTAVSADGANTSATVVGTSVRVQLADTGTVEVTKNVEGDIPDSESGRTFTFTISDADGVMANQKYLVYTYTGGEWVLGSMVHSTDINGQFTLADNQKAVFNNVPNVSDVTVEEVQHINYVKESSEASNGNLKTYEFTNTFHPVLFVQKTTSMTGDLTDEELDSYEFTFQALVDDGTGNYVALANSLFYYVDSTDPDTANILSTGMTDENGYFTLKSGEIAALYPGETGTAYKVIESDTGDEWECKTADSTVSGTVAKFSSSKTFTNMYMLRNLIVTKELTSQDTDECTSTFTFKVTDPEGNAVTGNYWYEIDENGNATGVDGYLTDDGEFTITGAGDGHRVKVTGLTAGKTYTVTETGYDADLYEPVNGGTADAKMAMYVLNKSVTITNKYLLRDLTVSKLVVSSTLTEDDIEDLKTREFTMTLEKYENGEWVTFGGAAYTINGTAYTTNDDGTFTLKNGETAVFGDIGYVGDQYRISEAEDGTYGQVLPANGEPATATLTESGASVRFINGEEGLAAVTKSLSADDANAQAFVDLIKDDNTTKTITDSELGAVYAVEMTIQVLDGNGDVSDDTYTYIYAAQDGTVTTDTFSGTLTLTVAPYDYVFIAGVPDGYTVTASEADLWENKVLRTSPGIRDTVGTTNVLSYTDELTDATEAGGEPIEIVNNIVTAEPESVIYKTMTEGSTDVATGAKLTYRVETYTNGAWCPAGGIEYIIFDDTGSITGIETTDVDGLVTVAKTDNGYPYVWFLNADVKANVTGDIEEGTYRIVETGADEEWGILAGYSDSSLTGGNSVAYTDADTFVNANDSGQVLEVEKAVDGDSDAEFTFTVAHVLSASELPITSTDQILGYEAGAELYYVVYDTSSGSKVSDGYTDANGQFTISAGQYAKVYVPDDTVWWIYENQASGYQLEEVTATGDNAAVLEGGTSAAVSTEKELEEKHYTLTDGLNFQEFLFDENNWYSEVTSITFGLTEDYADVIAGVKGERVGETKDDLIYLYRVGTDYYVLSDHTIHFNEDCYCMFYNCTNLSSLTFDNIDMSSVTDMSYMFYYCTSLSDLSPIANWDVLNITDMTGMFGYCTSLSDLSPIANWDVLNITNMTEMFYYCTSLSDLSPIANWDVSNVTIMKNMFCGCSSLTDLSPITDWDVSNVTDMVFMFGYCTSLSDLSPIANWDVSNVEYWLDMFLGSNVTITDVDVQDVILGWMEKADSWYGMFSSWQSITDVSFLSDIDTSHVTDMSYMFYHCTSLSDLSPIADWDVSSVTDMSYMFYYCTSLSDLSPIADWDVSSITDMSYMFYYCTSLSDLSPIADWDVSSVTDMSSMFNCSSLSGLSPIADWDVSSVTDMSYMFSSCTSLSDLSLIADWDVSNVTDMSYMFRNCTKINDITSIACWDVSSVESWTGMFRSNTVIENTDNLNVILGWMEKVDSWCGMFATWSNKSIDWSFLSDLDTSHVTNMGHMFESSSLSDLSPIADWDVSSVTDMSYMFNCSSLSGLSPIADWDVSSVTDMSYMFGSCTSLSDLSGLADWDTSSVTDMNSMFYYCTSLSDLSPIADWDVSSVTDMKNMFLGCTGLTTADLSSWDTSSVTSMEYMFHYCISLQTLDLSGWNTSNVTDMYGMFYYCTSLQTIYVGDGWSTDNLTADYYCQCDMFYYCTSLVGGSGTTYDSYHTGKLYARVDEGEDNPGYLTLKE